MKEGKLVTTEKKAKMLKAEADHFFSRLMSMFDMYKDEKDVRREAMRLVKSVIFSEAEGKKIVEEMMPKYKNEGKKFGFISNHRLWARKWDAAEKILLQLS